MAIAASIAGIAIVNINSTQAQNISKINSTDGRQLRIEGIRGEPTIPQENHNSTPNNRAVPHIKPELTPNNRAVPHIKPELTPNNRAVPHIRPELTPNQDN
ncbi:hypothetical protein Cyast_1934 [Cyanobacterium stanieri PCC 7202]|uniref:Uncharacterized protein n=1 Tax=Cyanobacterium stanieri (strain ATCC 29140 / PCC 7202) TaxID=292563 RepID=K9YN50_CYASC|nr:hypothetical protein Cyast_1934 [Cyanobacterium stanieri PCC 7202]